MRIPFDSFTLAAVVAELQCLVGTSLERFSQPDESSIVLGCFGESGAWLLICADPTYSRAHLIARRLEGLKPPPPFAQELKKRIAEGKVVFVRQRGLDRILEIGVDAPSGTYQIVAEIMGKHSNVMLVDTHRNVVAAMAWIGPAKSVRPVLPGKPYSPPPFAPKPSLVEATPGSSLMDFEGCSPFLEKLVKAGASLSEIQASIKNHTFHPVFSEGNGAYPASVVPLGLQEVSRTSISFALEQHFDRLVGQDKFVRSAASLKGQLERVLLAREVALRDVGEAIEAARDARSIQTKGELILAYQGQIKPGDKTLEAFDYEGNAVSIPLKPDQTAIENAERMFSRAKRAKARAGEMESQFEKLESDRVELNASLEALGSATTVDEVNEVKALADQKRWLQKSGAARPREERPFEGHAVKELLSPGGWRVLYGDNATSNDYLTTKIARPSDFWFHVRGATSTHVVLCTNNQPTKVQPKDLEFAAKVAVRHSQSKHASYVSVDYTQKRYVRKPRGAAPGFAVYTHEKTIHVTGD